VLVERLVSQEILVGNSSDHTDYPQGEEICRY